MPIIHGMFISHSIYIVEDNKDHTIYSDWVLPEYGGGSHCDLFGACSFAARSAAFTNEDDAWFETEGICGANTCYKDSHCG